MDSGADSQGLRLPFRSRRRLVDKDDGLVQATWRSDPAPNCPWQRPPAAVGLQRLDGPEIMSRHATFFGVFGKVGLQEHGASSRVKVKAGSRVADCLAAAL
jgi:hypothetical protein